MRPSRTWILAPAYFVALLLLLVAPGLAREGDEAPPANTPAVSEPKGESSVLEYIRGAYRDPFRSLREPKLLDEGPRPDGPPGMLIEEIDVVGVLSGPRGAMVLILGSDGLG